jgi:uncharacterized protein YjbJ (UPF0337 family)
MDKAHIAGATKETKGAIKETAGKFLGDTKLTREGETDRAEGRIWGTISRLKDAQKSSGTGSTHSSVKPAFKTSRRPSWTNQKERPMTRSIRILAGTALLAALMSGQAFAQGAPQTVTLMKVDPASLATGYRTSKVVGSTVVNEANETVGTIDDLIVTPTDKVPFAVLSVGGFLGMGARYVVVPFSSLQVKDKQMVLPGATKDSLKALPEFKYNTAT